jgi:hypothetical protein
MGVLNTVAVMALTVLAATPTAALANTPGQPLANVARADLGEGVTAFPAAYFAAARPNTAFDMIQRLPGFTFDGGAQIRGFAGAAGNVLIDGERPTSKQDDLKSALTRVSATQVARIELIRGGAPGIDMQGRTVMANVILKHDGGSQGVAQLQNKVSLDSGRYMPGVLLQWSRRSGEHTFEAALSTLSYLDDGAGPGPHYAKDGTGAYTYDSHLWTQAGGNQGNFTSAYSGPLAGGRFRINGLVFLDHYVDHEADRATLPVVNGDDAYKDANATLKSELGVHYTRDLGAKTTLEALAIQQLSRQHEHARYIAFGDDEIFDIVNTAGESIARSTLRYRALPTLTIEAAMEGAYNTQSTATAYSINAIPQILPAANEMVAETRGEAALSATWSPSPKYTLEAGVRYEASQVMATGDVNEGKSLFYLKPRAVFTWSPDPKDQVRLRVEREVGQLDFSAFTASGSLNAGGLHAGNPNALPQAAWVVEGAFERRFWGKGDATVTLRRSQITNAVDRIAFLDPVAQTFFDEGGNLPTGVENDLIFDVTVPLDRLWLKNALFKTTATWRDARVTDPITGMQRAQTQVHPLELAAHFTQDLASIKSTWGLDYVNGWVESYYRFDEIDVYRYGARLNAFFEYKPTANLSLRADATDLFSRGFERTIILYPGPRNASPTPALIDQRDQQIGPLIMFTVRRSFG